jgi:hypothetical protein
MARERLSRFFTWPSLRFAAPALALFLGGLCIYVYVVKKPEENFVAVRLDDRGDGATPVGARDEGDPGDVRTEQGRQSITSASSTPEPTSQAPTSETRGESAATASDKSTTTADPSPPDIRKRGGVTVAPPDNNESPSDAGRSLSREMPETRAGLSYAAGHQFRREGAAWVDVDYNKSMALIRLRRGSDAYLSAAADQPALRVVAEQLSGEVIIVMGNRAYSIR